MVYALIFITCFASTKQCDTHAEYFSSKAECEAKNSIYLIAGKCVKQHAKTTQLSPAYEVGKTYCDQNGCTYAGNGELK